MTWLGRQSPSLGGAVWHRAKRLPSFGDGAFGHQTSGRACSDNNRWIRRCRRVCVGRCSTSCRRSCRKRIEWGLDTILGTWLLVVFDPPTLADTGLLFCGGLVETVRVCCVNAVLMLC